jgi:hypothetical protein
VGNPEGRLRRRWVDNIKMLLRGRGWDGMNWIDVAQDRDQWKALVNTVMILVVPLNLRKFLSNLRRAQLHAVSYFT